MDTTLQSEVFMLHSPLKIFDDVFAWLPDQLGAKVSIEFG